MKDVPGRKDGRWRIAINRGIKDYKDGSSFTEKVCKTILGLKKQGYDTETIVDAIDNNVDKHLESVVSLIPDNKIHINDNKKGYK